MTKKTAKNLKIGDLVSFRLKHGGEIIAIVEGEHIDDGDDTYFEFLIPCSGNLWISRHNYKHFRKIG